jgi:hypothetical protein
MDHFAGLAVHPKDVRDCLPRQLFEVPFNQLLTKRARHGVLRF